MNYEKLRRSDTHDTSPLGLLVEAWTAYGPTLEALVRDGIMKVRLPPTPTRDPSITTSTSPESRDTEA